MLIPQVIILTKAFPLIIQWLHNIYTDISKTYLFLEKGIIFLCCLSGSLSNPLKLKLRKVGVEQIRNRV